MSNVRITVNLSDEVHRGLKALARERGLRGYSLIVQEALDLWIAKRFRPEEIAEFKRWADEYDREHGLTEAKR